eukprot:TRINITY_DN6566_c0_g1_i1.p1 TRINITY_DN6566_c0_g1~~TRINITY_DN6566_c0_g1_i1.p1  ORF type:complete len:2125 (-),score=494.54 TRINITY_DN6566_c0_g1_i1:1432-7806(-)
MDAHAIARYGGKDDLVAAIGSSPKRSVLAQQESGTGKTVLHLACERGHSALVSWLLTCKTDPNLVDSMGMTSLHVACTNGHVEIALQVLKGGGDTELKCKYGNTALHHACLSGFGQRPHDDAARLKLVTALVDNNEPLAVQNIQGCTPLHLCAGDHSLVSFLVQRGADVAAKDRFGETPLNYAQRFHTQPTVSFLTGTMAVEDILEQTPAISSEHGVEEADARFLVHKVKISGSRVGGDGESRRGLRSASKANLSRSRRAVAHLVIVRGRVMVVCEGDGTVRLMDAHSGDTINTYRVKASFVRVKGEYMFVVISNTVLVWPFQAVSKKGTKSPPCLKCSGHKKPISSICYDARTGRLYTASPDGTCLSWQIDSSPSWVTQCASVESTTNGTLYSDGQTPRPASPTPRSSKVPSGEEVPSCVCFKCDTDVNLRFTSIALAKRGQLLAAGTKTGAVVLWNIADGSVVRQCDVGHSSPVVWLRAVGRDQMISGAADGARLWELADGKNTTCYSVEEESQLRDSTDSADGLVRHAGPFLRMILPAGNEIPTTEGENGLVLVAHNQSVVVWDVASGRKLGDLEGHTERVSQLHCIGRCVFTGAEDGTIRQWVVPALEPEGKLSLPVNVMLFYKHGKAVTNLCGALPYLYSSSADSTVRCWHVAPPSAASDRVVGDDIVLPKEAKPRQKRRNSFTSKFPFKRKGTGSGERASSGLRSSTDCASSSSHTNGFSKEDSSSGNDSGDSSSWSGSGSGLKSSSDRRSLSQSQPMLCPQRQGSLRRSSNSIMANSPENLAKLPRYMQDGQFTSVQVEAATLIQRVVRGWLLRSKINEQAGSVKGLAQQLAAFRELRREVERFSQCMRDITDVYMIPMLAKQPKGKGRVVDIHSHAALFTNVADVAAVHHEFAKTLATAAETSPFIDDIGNVTLSMIGDSSCHVLYALTLQQSQITYAQNVEQSSKFRNFVQEARKTCITPYSLPELLVMPVCIVRTYARLLKRLAAFTQKIPRNVLLHGPAIVKRKAGIEENPFEKFTKEARFRCSWGGDGPGILSVRFERLLRSTYTLDFVDVAVKVARKDSEEAYNFDYLNELLKVGQDRPEDGFTIHSHQFVSASQNLVCATMKNKKATIVVMTWMVVVFLEKNHKIVGMPQMFCLRSNLIKVVERWTGAGNNDPEIEMERAGSGWVPVEPPAAGRFLGLRITFEVAWASERHTFVEEARSMQDAAIRHLLIHTNQSRVFGMALWGYVPPKNPMGVFEFPTEALMIDAENRESTGSFEPPETLVALTDYLVANSHRDVFLDVPDDDEVCYLMYRLDENGGDNPAQVLDAMPKGAKTTSLVAAILLRFLSSLTVPIISQPFYDRYRRLKAGRSEKARALILRLSERHLHALSHVVNFMVSFSSDPSNKITLRELSFYIAPCISRPMQVTFKNAFQYKTVDALQYITEQLDHMFVGVGQGRQGTGELSVREFLDADIMSVLWIDFRSKKPYLINFLATKKSVNTLIHWLVRENYNDDGTPDSAEDQKKLSAYRALVVDIATADNPAIAAQLASGPLCAAMETIFAGTTLDEAALNGIEHLRRIMIHVLQSQSCALLLQDLLKNTAAMQRMASLVRYQSLRSFLYTIYDTKVPANSDKQAYNNTVLLKVQVVDCLACAVLDIFLAADVEEVTSQNSSFFLKCCLTSRMFEPQVEKTETPKKKTFSFFGRSSNQADKAPQASSPPLLPTNYPMLLRRVRTAGVAKGVVEKLLCAEGFRTIELSQMLKLILMRAYSWELQGYASLASVSDREKALYGRSPMPLTNAIIASMNQLCGVLSASPSYDIGLEFGRDCDNIGTSTNRDVAEGAKGNAVLAAALAKLPSEGEKAQPGGVGWMEFLQVEAQGPSTPPPGRMSPTRRLKAKKDKSKKSWKKSSLRNSCDISGEVEGLTDVQLKECVATAGDEKKLLLEVSPRFSVFADPVGFKRISAIHMTTSLLNERNAVADAALQSSDLLLYCVNMFFGYKHNNQLHEVLSDAFQALFECPLHSVLQVKVVHEYQFMRKVLRAFKLQSILPGSEKLGYIGHLRDVVKLVHVAPAVIASLKSSAATGDKGLQREWGDFVDREFRKKDAELDKMWDMPLAVASDRVTFSIDRVD